MSNDSATPGKRPHTGRPAVLTLMALMALISASATALAAGDGGSEPAKTSPPAAAAAATAEEVQALRTQLDEATRQIQQLTGIVEKLQQRLDAAEPAEQAGTGAISTVPAVASVQDNQQSPPVTNPDSKSPIDTLIAPKSEGGQFSGAGGLVKTDKVKIGGYADFRYQTRGIDESLEIGETLEDVSGLPADQTNFRRNGFQMPRLVLSVASAITDKILFNSEIEYEFGGEEVDVEQAYLEYRFHPMFNVRGGIVIAPVGRFNLFHDSNLQDISPRPLVSTFVIPSTFSDAGVGAFGEFNLPKGVRLTYEGYVSNGLRSDEGGEIVRDAGLIESKGLRKLVDNNSQKAVMGRLMISPVLGLELGVSGYRGKHDSAGAYDASIWAVDWLYRYKGFQIVGEYARNAFAQPDESPETVAARNFLLALPDGVYTNTYEFINETINEPLFDATPHSTDGYYVEARYRFQPKWFAKLTTEDGSIAPVFRYDRINLDRDFPDFRFPLNQARTTIGVSIRPTEAAGFNFSVHFNRDPDIDLRLPDNRPFPPYQTNLGATGFSMAWVWAF
jgi:hypothetical protein